MSVFFVSQVASGSINTRNSIVVSDPLQFGAHHGALAIHLLQQPYSMADSSNTPPTIDLVAQVATLTVQV